MGGGDWGAWPRIPFVNQGDGGFPKRMDSVWQAYGLRPDASAKSDGLTGGRKRQVAHEGLATCVLQRHSWRHIIRSGESLPKKGTYLAATPAMCPANSITKVLSEVISLK